MASVGVEPQVVTLTLDALLSNSFNVTHTYIIHPNPKHPQIDQALKQLQKERAFYKSKGLNIKFSFVPIRDGDHYPTDFVTEQDVALVLKVLYRTVVGLKRQGYRIHLSISGGRKVMTAMGMVIAQLLLGEGDYVWHLLSEGRLLESRSMHARNPKDVALIPVPVLRWSLLPSTLNELLVWDDPYSAIERQKQLQRHQRLQLLQTFWQGLTPAEREVVKALVRYSEKADALAKRLNRSPKTVRNQLCSIYAKYRDHFDLPSESKVRERLIADLAPALAILSESEEP